MPDIDFPTSDGTAPGYLATPQSGSGPATIVLQEWWGLDEHVRSICDASPRRASSHWHPTSTGARHDPAQ